MAGSDSDQGKPTGRPGVGARKHDWIARQLQRVYEEALDEEIPADMLALLGKLDDKLDDSSSPDREGEA